MMGRGRGAFQIAIGLVLVVLSGQASADPAPGASSSGDNASEQGGSSALQEIVVTATRREESIEKVPVSVVAISQDALTQGFIKNVADVAAMTPGLQFLSPQGSMSQITTISIRGLNSNVGTSSVGLYVDDTPIQGRLSPAGNFGSPYPVVFDLNRIEVERGPQGTLFGAGSEAGAVRWITNAPSLTAFSGFAHSELAETERGGVSQEVAAAAGGPIIENELGFRLSAWERRDGGYVDLVNPITGNIMTPNANSDTKQAFRVALAYQPTDGVLITPSVAYQRIVTNDGGKFYPEFSDPSQGVFINEALLPEHTSDQFLLASTKIEAKLPFADLVSTTSYMDRKAVADFDETIALGALGAPIVPFNNPGIPWLPTSPIDALPNPTYVKTRGFTEEVRLSSNAPNSLVSWVAGVFYDHRKQEDYSVITSPAIDPTGGGILSGGDVLYADQFYTDDQIAVFAQGDLHITDKWTATLGERVARVKTDLLLHNGTTYYNAGSPALEAATLKQTPTTPRVALTYQATPTDLFYASASKGFRVGGGNASLLDTCDYVPPDTYKSDYVWSYEAGAKNTLFNGHLQVDSSAFHIKWTQIQQSILLACGSTYTANTGSAVSNGFDLALQALIVDGFVVNLGVGYTDAYFTRSVYNNTGTLLVQSGDKIGALPQVNSPWDVNTAATYTTMVHGGDSIHFRAEYQYHSRNPGPFVNHIPTSGGYYPLDVADPPTHLFNLRAGIAVNSWDLTFFVDNVFNSHPLLATFQISPTADAVTASTFRPRTAGLSINYSFGK